MNYSNLIKSNFFTKLARYSLVCAALFLSFAIFFFSKNTSSQTITDCASVSGSIQPGNNCGFFGLKLCKIIDGVNYTIPASNIFTSSPKRHRVDCADLSDLPLCSQIDPTKDANGNIINSNQNVGGNCAVECSGVANAASGTRGQDYARHNRDCVRFCDAIEAGVTASALDGTCVVRKCHQVVGDTVVPASPACEFTDCDLLTKDEMNESRITTPVSPKKYCNGIGRVLPDGSITPIKCFDFKKETLEFVRPRGNSNPATHCQIHNCRADSESCGSYASDDISKILAKETLYSDEYKLRLNANLDLITNKSFCVPRDCRPVVKRYYNCSAAPGAAENTAPTVKNTNYCDAESSCSSGSCYKMIDCNLSTNSSEVECTSSDTNDDGSVGSSEDTVNSWFYRPEPMGKALNDSGGFVQMDVANICYRKSNMEANHWGYHDLWADLYYHQYSSGSYNGGTRSPGLCNSPSHGGGGRGYGYLCNTNGDYYQEASEDTAYHKGYVRTSFSANNDATHTVTVCLRFNNMMIPWKSCGRRECGITCSFGSCESDVCGRDRCYDLEVKDSDADECMMTNDLFSINRVRDEGVRGVGGKKCLKVVDENIRIRVVKYDNRICTFLDMNGSLAYDADYFSGNEHLTDGTCFSGVRDAATGNCTGGKNTNSSPGYSNRYWRTVRHIPYITNNRTSGPQGYLDLNGRLFPAQECIQTTLRVPPPRLWNLANESNASKLFLPPLQILNAKTSRGGEISVASPGEIFGKTSFHYPEIEVKFGTTNALLSLGIGKTGYETTDIDTAGSQSLTTTFAGNSYTIETFVTKEFNDSNKKPIFCFYRKVRIPDGSYLEPIRVGCVERRLPEINNASLREISPSIAPERLVLAPTASNTYNNATINIKYLAGFGANGIDNGCTGDDICASLPLMTNADYNVESCGVTTEKYKICVQRDFCNSLESECVTNYINIRNSGSNAAFEAIKRDCEEQKTLFCNARNGIDSSGVTTFANAHGWFNEICITKGFEEKLNDIIAYKTTGGVMGKCLIDETKSSAALSANSRACDKGGNAAIGCFCRSYFDSITLAEDQTHRIETAHEAGLCVEIPTAQRCPKIDYNTTANTANPSDPEYINDSIDKALATTFTTTSAANYAQTVPAGGVHLSHRLRSLGDAFTSGVNASLVSHAEFPQSIVGMTEIPGVCKGFWRNDLSPSSQSLTPTMSCLASASGTVGTWSSSVTNDCVRYTCPRIFTNDTGAEADGTYSNGYGILEAASDKGLSNGYALWPSHSQISDFAETVNASACLPGFKASGASTTVNTSATGISSLISPSLSTNLTIASLYNRITSYSGGTLPNRACNQQGNWSAFDSTTGNSCVRIKCPAITAASIDALAPATGGVRSNKNWELWRNTGGATFPETVASRSNVRTQEATETGYPTGSKAVGTCNAALKFYQLGTTPPTRKCDHLGNWLPVESPCSTTCDAISPPTPGQTDIAANATNGYAYWNQAGVDILGESSGVVNTAVGSGGCVAGRVPYPYPPLKNKYGIDLEIGVFDNYRTDSGDNANLSTIPLDISLDTREPTQTDRDATLNTKVTRLPKRICTFLTTESGDTSNAWAQTDSMCIDRCPGYSEDSRIGVGRTDHVLSNGVTESVRWDSQILNAYQTKTNCDGPGTQFSAADFIQGRTNGCYLLRRKCNANGSWSPPEAMCIAKNNGIIGNATYSVTGVNNNTNAAVAGSATNATGACVTNYWKSNRDQAAAPTRQCVFDTDFPNKIDKVYWKMNAGSPDCTMITCLTPTGNSITDAENRVSFSIATERNVTTEIEGVCSARSLLSGTPPKVTCSNTGEWSNIVDASHCAFTCTIPDNPDRGLNADECGGGITFRLKSFTLASGQSATLTACDTCVSGTHEGYGWWYYASCNDGTSSVVEDWKDHSEKLNTVGGTGIQHMCPTRVYNPNTATWTTVLNSPNGDSGSAITSGKQAGVVRNNLGVFINGSGVRTRLSNSRDIGRWTVQIDPAPAP